VVMPILFRATPRRGPGRRSLRSKARHKAGRAFTRPPAEPSDATRAPLPQILHQGNRSRSRTGSAGRPTRTPMVVARNVRRHARLRSRRRRASRRLFGGTPREVQSGVPPPCTFRAMPRRWPVAVVPFASALVVLVRRGSRVQTGPDAGIFLGLVRNLRSRAHSPQSPTSSGSVCRRRTA
jgi:hypothetical protein